MLATETRPRLSRHAKLLPALLIAITLLVTLSPIAENWKPKPTDSFPLSYYPMFSFKRGKTFTGQTLAGLDTSGNRVLLSYDYAGTGGFNQVRRQIAAKVKDGRAGEVCLKVAGNVARSGDSAEQGIEHIQVISARHRVDSFFRGDRTAISEKIHATCEVPSRTQLATGPKETSR